MLNPREVSLALPSQYGSHGWYVHSLALLYSAFDFDFNSCLLLGLSKVSNRELVRHMSPRYSDTISLEPSMSARSESVTFPMNFLA